MIMVNCKASETESLCIVTGLALDEYTIHGNEKKGAQMYKGSLSITYIQKIIQKCGVFIDNELLHL